MRSPALLMAAMVLAGCSHSKGTSYPIHGQVIGFTAATPTSRGQVTLKHDDIPGFMSAMTMPYFVKDPHNLDGLAAGDVVDAKLVVEDDRVSLDEIRKVGHAPVPAGAKAIRMMDVMAPGDAVPDDALQDQTGAPRRLSEWRGRVLAVTFVYTRCPLPDFCPLMDRHFGALQKAIKEDARLRDRAHLVSISFDPAHDTPEAIRAHAAARGADPAVWSYLTGTPDAIEHLTSRFGVSTIQETDAAGTITHNLRTAIVDPEGRLVKVYTGNDWSPDALLNDLRVHAR
jgi:protein SCO1